MSMGDGTRAPIVLSFVRPVDVSPARQAPAAAETVTIPRALAVSVVEDYRAVLNAYITLIDDLLRILETPPPVTIGNRDEVLELALAARAVAVGKRDSIRPLDGGPR